MALRRKRDALTKAREVKNGGDLERAVTLLTENGLVDEAANWLAQAQRYREAARLLLQGLDTRPEAVEILEPEGRKRVLMAAIYFERGAEPHLALPLYDALGETQRAERLRDSIDEPTPLNAPVSAVLQAQKTERSGDREQALAHYVHLRQYREAGRIARDLGRLDQAAELFSLGEYYFEAAVCYMDVGDLTSCMDSLVRIDDQDERYRPACMQAIRAAVGLGDISFDFDRFIGQFVDTGPIDALEAESFFTLAHLYLRVDLPENAIEALEKVLAFDPHYPDARLVLETAKAKQTPGSLSGSRPSDSTERKEARPLAQRFTPIEVSNDRPAATTQALGADFTTGSIIDGRFKIEEVIGRGSSAIVMRATNMQSGTQVALKVLTEVLPDEKSDVRFRREVAVTTALEHDNIVRVFNVGEFGGRRYLVMELLVGEPLDVRIERQRATLEEAVEWTRQICAGLDTAHRLGIVHRDIKPANLFLDTTGTIKIMDFGLARKLDASLSITGGQITGTPRYMSPEQINQGKVSPATDMYALGVVLYELVTGQPPFVANELVQILMMHSTATPMPPHQLNPNVPGILNGVILKLLEKQPEARIRTATELVTSLSAWHA